MSSNLIGAGRGLLVAAAMLASACSFDNNEPDAADIAKGDFSSAGPVALKVGELPADFALADAAGQEVTLSSYRGRSRVMLLFYRGSWCPFCVGHLEDLQSLLPSLADYDVQLLALSPDSAEDSQKLAEKFDQPYRFLMDKDLKVADTYGIRRDEKLPHPAVILIDRDGSVRWFYVGEDYQTRPSASQLRAVLAKLWG